MELTHIGYEGIAAFNRTNVELKFLFIVQWLPVGLFPFNRTNVELKSSL